MVYPLASSSPMPVVCKSAALQGLGEDVSKHLHGWAVLHVQISLLNSVHNKEVVNVNVSDVSCAFATGCLPIVLKKDGTLIVLVHCDMESLISQKITCPINHHWHSFIDPHELGLCGALGI